MFVSLRTITLPADRSGERDTVIDRLRAAAGELPGVRSCWIGAVGPGPAAAPSQIGWRMTFATEREALAAPHDAAWARGIAPLLQGLRVDGVGYQVTRSGGRRGGEGIWRALVFRVAPQGFPQGAREIEALLLMFPKYVPAIRSWALSPVSTFEGPKAYTHVWEQEYDTVEGLSVDYMNAPIHWGLIGPYFDAEYPECVVDPQVLQMVGRIERTIMT